MQESKEEEQEEEEQEEEEVDLDEELCKLERAREAETQKQVCEPAHERIVDLRGPLLRGIQILFRPARV